MFFPCSHFQKGGCHAIVGQSHPPQVHVTYPDFSANMAFLALNDINTLSRTASIASTLFAIGSIVIGLHHVWGHRQKAHTDAHHAVIYFNFLPFATKFTIVQTGNLSPKCDQHDPKSQSPRIFSQSPISVTLMVAHHLRLRDFYVCFL